MKSRAKITDYGPIMAHIGHWSWVHLIYRFDASHLIVGESGFIQFLRAARKEKLEAQVAVYNSDDLSSFTNLKKILVFLPERELETVRHLQQLYPNVIVVSGTYGYACVGKNRTPKMAVFEARQAPKPRGRHLFLATSYAGAEFIGAVMSENGLQPPHEYFARPLIRWLEYFKGFQSSRFLAEIEARYSQKNGSLPAQLLQADLLTALLEKTALSEKRLISFLGQRETKVVFVSRRDVISQSVEAQLLEHTAERSVWTKSPNKKLENKPQQAPFPACFKRLQALKKEQKFLEYLKAILPAGVGLDIVLEDFIEDQQEGLRQIAAHLGLELSDTVRPIDYRSAFVTAEHIPQITVNLARQFIDRSGIHHLPA